MTTVLKNNTRKPVETIAGRLAPGGSREIRLELMRNPALRRQVISGLVVVVVDGQVIDAAVETGHPGPTPGVTPGVDEGSQPVEVSIKPGDNPDAETGVESGDVKKGRRRRRRKPTQETE